jgi:hypothetical protein
VKPPLSNRRCAAQADRLARSVLEALGVGAIRPRHPRQHRAAAGRRCRRGAHRGRAEGPCAHLRRDAALLRGRSVRGRQAGGGGSLAQHHRGRRDGRSRSPTISISAIQSGPRSWASSSAACAASRSLRARRSTSRSCPATCRSTTRPTAAASCRRRPSAVSACCRISRRPRPLPSRTMARRLYSSATPQAGSASRSICAKSAAARRGLRRRSISLSRNVTATSCASMIRRWPRHRGP